LREEKMKKLILIIGVIFTAFLMVMTPCISATESFINKGDIYNYQIETLDEYNWRLTGLLGLLKFTIFFVPYSILLALIFASIGFNYSMEHGSPIIRISAGIVLSPITLIYTILKMILMIIYNDFETPYGPLCIFLQKLITKLAELIGANVIFDPIFPYSKSKI